MNTLALGHHRNCLRAVDVLITPLASHAHAHGAFGTLEPLPIRLIAIRQEDFTKMGAPMLSLCFPTRSVIFSSSLCVPIHHGDSRLGSMSRSSNSSMMSFTMHIDLSVVTEQPVVVSLRHPTQHVLVVMPSAKGQPPNLWLSTPQHVFGHTSPQHGSFHAALADASRIPETQSRCSRSSRIPEHPVFLQVERPSGVRGLHSM